MRGLMREAYEVNDMQLWMNGFCMDPDLGSDPTAAQFLKEKPINQSKDSGESCFVLMVCDVTSSS